MKPSDQLKNARERARIRNSIYKIKKIKPHIHRVRLSSNSYSIKTLQERLGDMFIPDDSKELVKERMPIYDNMGFIKKHDLAVFFSRPISMMYFPQCIIEMKDVEPKKLVKLHKEAPDFKISYIEYAIDFYFDSPEEVGDMFYVLLRTMYFHHAKDVTMSGGEYHGWREPRKENAVYRIKYGGKKKNIGVVIYERGPDELKKYGISWNHSDVDRVRLEFRIYRRSNKLQKIGISSLSDLINSPKFHLLCFKENGQDEIQFKCFDKGDAPKLWEDYLAGYPKNAVESLQEEYFWWNSEKSNIKMYMVDHPLLASLREKIELSLIKADEKWKKDVKKKSG